MPRATVTVGSERFDLETCPGGYVELRTLSFHEMEVRKDIAGRMYQEEQVGTAKKRQKRGGKFDDEEILRAYFESANVKVTEYEFRNCITEHNLYVDDAETQLIDFTKPMHTWKLDPKIGEEISGFIARLTQIDEDDVAPLPTLLSSSFSNEENGQSESMETN